MKKVILVIAILLIATAAQADWNPCGNSVSAQIWNRCEEQATKYRSEVGVKLEVVLYEGDEGDILNEVVAQYSNDWNNGNDGYYVKLSTKLSDIIDSVKGLFNKDE